MEVNALWLREDKLSESSAQASEDLNVIRPLPGCNVLLSNAQGNVMTSLKGAIISVLLLAMNHMTTCR